MTYLPDMLSIVIEGGEAMTSVCLEYSSQMLGGG